MRRTRTLTLLILLCVISTGFGVHLYRWQQASLRLIAALQSNDTLDALAALQAGADANARADSGVYVPRTPDWHFPTFVERPSFEARCRQLFASLFHSRDRDTIRASGEPPNALFLCIYNTRTDNPLLVKALLDSGADPNATSFYGLTPLGIATQTEQQPRTVQLLQQYGGHIYRPER